jgi:hypothetical protein
MKLTDIDKRLSIQEEKVDCIAKSVEEVKQDMKKHLDISNTNDEKLNTKLDKILWAMLAGLATIIIKLMFF